MKKLIAKATRNPAPIGRAMKYGEATKFVIRPYEREEMGTIEDCQ